MRAQSSFNPAVERSMPGKFIVSLTCAKDDTDQATVAFVVVNAAVGQASGRVSLHQGR